MFQDLDATLRTVLADPAAPADLRGAEITFVTPDKDFAPTDATVDLFLHDVQENRTLRDEAPLVERSGNGYLSRQPLLRVDCTYLTTTWSAKSGGLKSEEEHRLLGSALLWLSRFPVLDDRFLQGGLRTPPQPYPLVTMVAQTREGQPLGEFWSALGIAPRPAFSLTVTITLQPFDEVAGYPAVAAVHLETTSLTAPALQGQVLDGALAPVPTAHVTVVELGRAADVDRSGRFAFGATAFGHYTLTVQVPGHPDQQTQVDYQADQQVHNVIVPGP